MFAREKKKKKTTNTIDLILPSRGGSGEQDSQVTNPPGLDLHESCSHGAPYGPSLHAPERRGQVAEDHAGSFPREMNRYVGETGKGCTLSLAKPQRLMY